MTKNTLNQKRETNLNLCEQALEETTNIIERTDKHEIIRNIASYIHDRVIEIKKISQVEKYNIYFNGRVGIGKSTAISNLFNLIKEDKFKKGSRLSDVLLLKTASGRTTICETEIIQSLNEESQIIIEPVTKNDFEINLKEYCNNIFFKGNKEDSKQKLNKELIRFIDNMLDVPADCVTNSEKSKYIRNKLDLNHLEGNESIDKIFNKAISFIDYKNRNKTKFAFLDGDFRAWLKDSFEKINDGIMKNIPLPKKLIVKIDIKHLDMKLPFYVNKIIDTRGLDGGDRKDIQDSIKSEDSISLMCDEINGIGKDRRITGILKQVLIKENKDSKQRVFLLGIEQETELEEVNGADYDRKRGEKIKKQEAVDSFEHSNITLHEDNIIFYNSFQGIDSIKKKIVYINEDEYIQERVNFFQFLESRLLNMYLEYKNELLDLLMKINLLEKNMITGETLEKLGKCKDAVKKYREEVLQKTFNFIDKFKDDFQSVHPAVLRATVNRWGSYVTYNVYEMSQRLGGEDFESRCLETKSTMLGEFDGIFGKADEIQEVCIQSLKAKVDVEYLNFYEKSRKLYYSETFKKLHNDNTWRTPYYYWGDGKGNYRGRVSQDLIKSIKSNNINHLLENLNLIENFFDKVENFLEF